MHQTEYPIRACRTLKGTPVEQRTSGEKVIERHVSSGVRQALRVPKRGADKYSILYVLTNRMIS